MSSTPSLPSLFAHTKVVDCPGEGSIALAETRPGFPSSWRCPTCGMGLPRLKARGKAVPTIPAHGTRPSWIGHPNGMR